MADRSLDTAPVISTTQDAQPALAHVLQNGENKLLPITLLLSMITKQTLNLGNVNNTSDNEKLVSTHQQAAIEEAVGELLTDISQKIQYNSMYIPGQPQTIGAAVNALAILLQNVPGDFTSTQQYLDMQTAISDMQTAVSQMSAPTSHMAIALAKIDSAFTPGIAFSFPIAFEDMVIEGFHLSLDVASDTEDTQFDLMVNGTSVLANPVILSQQQTVFESFEIIGQNDPQTIQSWRLMYMGDRLSGSFISVGAGARTPVLTIKWRKATPNDYNF